MSHDSSVRILLPVLILLVGLAGAIIIVVTRPKVEQRPVSFLPPLVRVQTVQLQDIRLSVSSQGTVVPRTETVLVSQVVGTVQFVFFPKIDADNVVAELTLPLGTPVEVTRQAVMRLEETARALETEFGEDRRVLRHILASVGEQPGRNESRGPVAGQALFVGSHLGEVNIELVPSENRTASSTEIANRWRELTGTIPDAVELVFTSSLFSAGAPINVQLASADYEALKRAAEQLKEKIAQYPGVFDVSDSFR
ncbi:MAG TPA: efflux RND transporter permease subunit [Deltaproteobacteria bacterium]|nr:efflux RND transporter permease subunit [Deltaproteobacteria bacterium]